MCRFAPSELPSGVKSAILDISTSVGPDTADGVSLIAEPFYSLDGQRRNVPLCDFSEMRCYYTSPCACMQPPSVLMRAVICRKLH